MKLRSDSCLTARVTCLLLGASLLACVLPTGAAAQVVVRGWVVERQSGSPIDQARVTVGTSSVRSATDGSFEIRVAEAAGSDSLRVEREGFLPVRLAFDRDVTVTWGLEIPMTALMPRPWAEEARAEALATAGRTGGRLWTREEFDIYVDGADHLLQLLAYSGFVEDISGSGAGSWCVQVRVGSECAGLWVNGESSPSERLSEWPADWLDSFVVVRPIDGPTPESSSPGSVMIFVATPPS